MDSSLTELRINLKKNLSMVNFNLLLKQNILDANKKVEFKLTLI